MKLRNMTLMVFSLGLGLVACEKTEIRTIEPQEPFRASEHAEEVDVSAINPQVASEESEVLKQLKVLNERVADLDQRLKEEEGETADTVPAENAQAEEPVSTPVTATDEVQEMPVAGTEAPEECVPSAFQDGRMAVPLVVTAHADLHHQGKKGQFVSDTPMVAMNDEITSLTIEKGPNYVTGDQVEFFDGGNYSGRSILLPPGSYSDLRNYDLSGSDGGKTNANDHIASLKIVRSEVATSQRCADVANDDLSWKKRIPIIVSVFESPDFLNSSVQIINDVASLGNFGRHPRGAESNDESMNDAISSLILFKGPDFEEGDYVAFFADLNGVGHSRVGRPTEWPTYLKIDNTAAEPWRMSESITSIHFFDDRGDRIYSPSDAE